MADQVIISADAMDKLTLVLSYGMRIKKMTKALIEVQRTACSGGAVARKAQAKAYRCIDSIQRDAREEAAQGTIDPTTAEKINGVANSILQDFKTHGPKLQIYKWILAFGDAIPDDQLPNKVVYLKRVAKMIQDADDDEELDQTDIDRILAEHEGGFNV